MVMILKNRLLKGITIFFLFLAAFVVYVEIANRNSKSMTYRQKVLKAIYPAYRWWMKLTGKKATELHGDKKPNVSFYSLSAKQNNGNLIEFSSLKGKKIMIVNTASDCGFTDQYAELQKLVEKYPRQLQVIGFPANDFKHQEKGTDTEIAAFCKANYGVTFPIIEKSVVVKADNQHPVYKWLSDPSLNGWNTKPPAWNFSKYIINEEGILTHYFGSAISPLDKVIIEAIEKER